MNKVTIGDCTLYLGDCLEVMKEIPDESVDAVITDPPYGMNLDTDFSKMSNPSGFKGLGTGHKYSEVIGDNKKFDPRPFLDFAQTTIFFGCDYFSNLLTEPSTTLVWDKRGNESADKAFGSPYELIWINQIVRKRFYRIRWYGLFGTEKQDIKERLHPAQKPKQLMAKLIFCFFKVSKTSPEREKAVPLLSEILLAS